MNTLPHELVEAILEQFVALGAKRATLQLRSVCRTFNYILKPYALQTLSLDVTRLNRAQEGSRPGFEALQTIGYHCRSLFVDMMVLRDEQEVNFFREVFALTPALQEFCDKMQKKFCLSDDTFTEIEFYDKLQELLFNCRQIEQMRLSLPFQMIGRHCDTSTMILANTFKAFASRPEDDSVPMKTLVFENITDIGICHLWVNPIDVQNIQRVLSELRHLVLGLRRHEDEPEKVRFFGSCMWNLIENADLLESLCIAALDHEERPPRGLKLTRYWHTTIEEWSARALPIPHINLHNLTSLELKRVEILPEVFIRAAEALSSTLEELFLNEVYLKTHQSEHWNQQSDMVLWVGFPNTRPPEDAKWIAMTLRNALPKLRVCRASFLAYDMYLMNTAPGLNTHIDFDLHDPSGLSRSLSQRFVEIIMGIQQPHTPSGLPIEYLPKTATLDHQLLSTLKKRKPLPVADYDVNAYHTDVANPTSSWLRSLDGNFPNLNSTTLDELHYMADTACRGMTEARRERTERDDVDIGELADPEMI